MRSHAILLVISLLLAAPSAQALTIDDFATDQIGFIAPGGPAATNFQGGIPATALGGSRELSISRQSGTGSIEFLSDDGIGNFGFGPSATGSSTLTYDGAADLVFNASGLGGADLTDGGVSSLLRVVLRSDIVGPLVVQLYSGAGNVSELSFATPGLGLGAAYTELLIPLASFVTVQGAGADLTNVGAVVFMASSSGAALDLQIDVIETVVPEPATAALLGLGLALTAGVTRRRAS